MTEPPAHEAVRQRLRWAGELRPCAFVVEFHCRKALRLLKETRPLEEGAAGIRAMIAELSLFASSSR